MFLDEFREIIQSARWHYQYIYFTARRYRLIASETRMLTALLHKRVTRGSTSSRDRSVTVTGDNRLTLSRALGERVKVFLAYCKQNSLRIGEIKMGYGPQKIRDGLRFVRDFVKEENGLACRNSRATTYSTETGQPAFRNNPPSRIDAKYPKTLCNTLFPLSCKFDPDNQIIIPLLIQLLHCPFSVCPLMKRNKRKPLGSICFAVFSKEDP